MADPAIFFFVINSCFESLFEVAVETFDQAFRLVISKEELGVKEIRMAVKTLGIHFRY